MIYLDNNATTAIDPRVKQAIMEAFEDTPSNPSSPHSFGRRAKQRLIAARDTIAKFLFVHPSEIIFTSGGTEGINLLLFGMVEKPCHIISTPVEHSSMLKCLDKLEKQGSQISYLNVGEYGAPKPEQVRDAICENTRLISLSLSNPETGVKLDLDEIAKIALDHGIPLLIDAVATLGKEPIAIPNGVTAMVFSGHKIHASQGVGFVFLRKHTPLQPLLFGGEQEQGRRSGTENLPSIVGLAKAISLLNSHDIDYIEELRMTFEQTIFSQINDVHINGTGPRISNTSNLFFEDLDGELLLMKLDQLGIAASLGSACASGGLEPSHILLGMGYNQRRSANSIRFSFSRMNTKEEVLHAANQICELFRRIKLNATLSEV